eukprot:403345958
MKINYSQILIRSFLSLSLIIYTINSQQHEFQFQEDLSIEDPFGQERGFKRIIAQPGEDFKIEIDDYFRGQFLEYHLRGETLIENTLLYKKVINFENPLQEQLQLTLSDSPNPIASFKTECIYEVEQSNGQKPLTYFFFIDQNLNLIAYDLSDYIYGELNDKPSFQISLYNDKYLSPFKSCAHLLQVEKFQIDFILLRNKSSSFFELVNLDLNTKNFTVKAFINNITYPNFDVTKPFITVWNLQIQDINVIPQRKGLILVSEYGHGMFILDIQCNSTKCHAYTKSIVSYNFSGGLQLLKLKVNDVVPNALASIIQPPIIMEINVQDSFNPYISRKYALNSDLNMYMGLNILDADERYIVFSILRIDDFKPFLRVYDRQETFASFAVAQIEIQNFYYNDIFIEFLQFNHFVVRTSEKLTIFKIQSPMITINTQEIQKYERLQPYDKILNLKINVRDLSNREVTRNIEVRFLPQDSNLTTSTVPYQRENQTLKSERIVINYNCGKLRDQINDEFKIIEDFELLKLDDLFSGPVSSMKVVTYDEQLPNNLLETKGPQILRVQIKVSDFSDCKWNQLIQFTDLSSIQHRVLCFSQNNFTLYTKDIIEQENRKLQPIKPYYLPQQTIKNFIVDSKNQNIYVFTDKNRQGEQLITLHILKLQNQFQWLQIIKIGEDFNKLTKDFIFADKNPLTWTSSIKMGAMISQQNQNNQVTILTFKISQSGDEFSFEFKAKLVLTLQSGVAVQHMQITKTQSLWLQLTNSTLLVYQQIRNYSDTELGYTMIRVQYFTYDNESLHLQYSEIGDNQLNIFLNKNTIRIFNIQEGSLELTSNMTLPLSYVDNQKAMETYQFTYDSSGNLLFTRHSHYLLVIFYDSDSKRYVLNAYNTRTSRHNSLYLQKFLQEDQYYFDPSFIQLNHIELSDTTIKLIITSINQTLLYDIDLSYRLTIDSENAILLDDVCQDIKQGLNLTYFVYPEGFQDQSVRIELRAQNNGLLITKSNKGIEHVTASELKNPQTYGKYLVDGSFNLNQFFQGFNMWYNITNFVGDSKYQTNSTLPSQFIVEDIIQQQPQIPLEFLTNRNKMRDLTTMDQFIVILDFDGYFIVTKQIQANFYERVLAEKIIGCKPNLFTQFIDNYFLFQCNMTDGDLNTIKFGVTQLYTTIPENCEEHEFYDFYGGELRIKRVVTHMQLTKQIQLSQIHVIDPDNLFIALVFDIPNQDYISIIEFYNVTFNTSEVVNIQYYQEGILSPYFFGFDQMKINSMQLIENTGIMTIGVQNYGLIVYDILRCKMIQSINLKKLMRYKDFKVQQIVLENTESLHLIMDMYGVVSIRIDNFTNFGSEMIDDVGYHIYTHFNFFDSEFYHGNIYALEPGGFAFITRQDLFYGDSTAMNFRYNVRYFTFDNDDNSKLLAMRSFPDGLNCQAIRYYPFQYALQYFKFSLPHNNYAFFGLQCDTDLNFYLFTRTFSIFYIHDSNLYNAEEQNERLSILAYNDYTEEQLELDVKFLRNRSQVPVVFYYLFVIAISGALLIFQLVFKAHAKTQLNKIELKEMNQKLIKQIVDRENQKEYFQNIKKSMALNTQENLQFRRRFGLLSNSQDYSSSQDESISTDQNSNMYFGNDYQQTDRISDSKHKWQIEYVGYHNNDNKINSNRISKQQQQTQDKHKSHKMNLAKQYQENRSSKMIVAKNSINNFRDDD